MLQFYVLAMNIISYAHKGQIIIFCLLIAEANNLIF